MALLCIFYHNTTQLDNIFLKIYLLFANLFITLQQILRKVNKILVICEFFKAVFRFYLISVATLLIVKKGLLQRKVIQQGSKRFAK
jgi:hypothetical protein